MIFGMCIGFLLGALVINVYLKDAEEEIKKQEAIIKNLNDDLDLANSRVEQRDNIIKDLQDKNKELVDLQKSN